MCKARTITGENYLQVRNPGVHIWAMANPGGDQPRRPKTEMDALKALVTVYGPREASRIAGVPFGTVSSYAFRYKWKKIAFKRSETGSDKKDSLSGMDASDVLAEALEKHRANSTLNLAVYVDKAAEKAAKHSDPLEVARKVRDVAGVHQIIFPQEEEGGLIEGAILIGTQKPELDVEEIEKARLETEQIIDVRAEIQDERPGSH